VADLHDRGQVQGVVEPAVAGPGQPVADDLAAGGLDRSGAGVGGEVVLGREPSDVADLAQQLGGQDGADAEQLGEGGRRPGDGHLEAVLGCGDPPVQGADVGEEVDGELPAGAGRRGLGPHPPQQGGCGIRVQVAPGAAWDQVGQQDMEAVEGLGAGPDQVIAAVRQQPQHGGVVLESDLAEPSGALGGHRDRDRVVGVALAAMAD
jgi:hypothetical protein